MCHDGEGVGHDEETLKERGQGLGVGAQGFRVLGLGF